MSGDLLGRKIKQAREMRGLTLRDLSAETGTALSYLARIEAGGTKRVGKDVILGIARVLKVDPVMLMDDSAVSLLSTLANSADQLPPAVEEFIRSQEALPWVLLAKDCSEADLSPEDARMVLEVVMRRMASKQ